MSGEGTGIRARKKKKKSQKVSHHTCAIQKTTDEEALWDQKNYPEPHFLLKAQEN